MATPFAARKFGRAGAFTPLGEKQQVQAGVADLICAIILRFSGRVRSQASRHPLLSQLAE